MPYSVSHPLWVRGLKLPVACFEIIPGESHPLRVRGLKPMRKLFEEACLCRTLCGCVD